LLVAHARSLLAQCRKREAAEACERAATLFLERGRADRAVEVWRRLSGIYRTLGRHEERIRVLHRRLASVPDDPGGVAHLELAAAFHDAGDDDRALGTYREEVRMHLAAAASEVLSDARAKPGPTRSRVVVALERIVALDPTDVPSRIALARFQLHGRPARALATLLEVLKIERRNVEALRVLDHAFLAVGQFDKAASAYEEIVRADPDAFERNAAHRDDAAPIAELLVRIDAAIAEVKLETALAAARAVVEANPGSIAARLKLKDVFLRLRNPDAAMQEVSRAVAIALEAGDVDHARTLLQVGLRLSPWHRNLREAAVRVTEQTKVFAS
jgi:tetratricopeptide (TPR) repeat protein